MMLGNYKGRIREGAAFFVGAEAGVDVKEAWKKTWAVGD